jgi:hypothetical protein
MAVRKDLFERAVAELGAVKNARQLIQELASAKPE